MIICPSSRQSWVGGTQSGCAAWATGKPRVGGLEAAAAGGHLYGGTSSRRRQRCKEEGRQATVKPRNGGTEWSAGRGRLVYAWRHWHQMEAKVRGEGRRSRHVGHRQAERCEDELTKPTFWI